MVWRFPGHTPLNILISMAAYAGVVLVVPRWALVAVPLLSFRATARRLLRLCQAVNRMDVRANDLRTAVLLVLLMAALTSAGCARSMAPLKV